MYSKGRKLYIKAIARVLVCALVIAGIFAVFMKIR